MRLTLVTLLVLLLLLALEEMGTEKSRFMRVERDGFERVGNRVVRWPRLTSVSLRMALRDRLVDCGRAKAALIL